MFIVEFWIRGYGRPITQRIYQPVEAAARAARKTFADTLAIAKSTCLTRFVLFDDRTFAAYADALS